ncbi:MAG: hypothetical protein ACJ8D8_17310 [Microvirga sp.]
MTSGPAGKSVVPTKRTWTQVEIAAELVNVDWSRIDRMSDEEIEAAAAADPDSYLPSDGELQEAARERAERLRKARKPAAE